jgi:hypothetical protein
MSKGFGKPHKSKLDILTESAIRYCQQRSPEKLDSIFDYQSPEINHKISAEVIAVVDIDTIAWFCGYLASEINCTQDNEKPYKPITELSGLLISFSMQVFEDFVPYPGCRLVIGNTEKFQSLPQEVQDRVNRFFEVRETSSEESQRINQAMLEELIVN